MPEARHPCRGGSGVPDPANCAARVLARPSMAPESAGARKASCSRPRLRAGPCSAPAGVPSGWHPCQRPRRWAGVRARLYAPHSGNPPPLRTFAHPGQFAEAGRLRRGRSRGSCPTGTYRRLRRQTAVPFGHGAPPAWRREPLRGSGSALTATSGLTAAPPPYGGNAAAPPGPDPLRGSGSGLTATSRLTASQRPYGRSGPSGLRSHVHLTKCREVPWLSLRSFLYLTSVLSCTYDTSSSEENTRIKSALALKWGMTGVLAGHTLHPTNPDKYATPTLPTAETVCTKDTPCQDSETTPSAVHSPWRTPRSPRHSATSQTRRKEPPRTSLTP